MECVIGDEALKVCGVTNIGGVANYVMLYDYSTFRDMVASGAVVYDPVNNQITDIVNPVGIQAYRFDQPNEAALTLGCANRQNDGGDDGFDMTVNMTIYGTLQEHKNQLIQMRDGKVVAVIFRKNGTGEVYGQEQGLTMLSNTYNPNDPNLGGVLPIVLSTSPRTPSEMMPPADVFKTDEATTKALILGLNVAGAV